MQFTEDAEIWRLPILVLQLCGFVLKFNVGNVDTATHMNNSNSSIIANGVAKRKGGGARTLQTVLNCGFKITGKHLLAIK